MTAGPTQGAGSWRFRLAAAALLLLMFVGWVVTAVAATARATVLDRAFYDRAIDGAQAYDRLYTQVLPDPAAAAVTDDLLARLPVDRSLVTANLRVVLPPATLRGLVDAQLDETLAYLRCRTDRLDLVVDLGPVFDNVAELANRFITDGVTGTPTYRAGSIQDFVSTALTVLDGLGRGRLPAVLPTLPLDAAQADTVATALLGRLDPASRAKLGAQVRVRVGEGDLAGALALVGPRLFGGDTRGVDDLRRRLDGGSVIDLDVRLSALRDKPTFAAVRALRPIAGATGWVMLAAGLSSAAALGGIAVLAERRGGHPVRWVAGGLAGLGASTLLAGWLIRLLLPDPFGPLTGDRSPLPPTARRLVADIADRLYGPLQAYYTKLGVGLLALGALVAVTAVAAPRLVAAVRAPGRRPRLVAFGIATPVLLTLSWLTFPRAAADTTLTCNGARQLCDRRYDQVVYAATHNSMANSEDRFLGPAQDPTMVHQLDSGVRALLIDTHYWTPAAEVQRFLDNLPPATRATLAPLVRPATVARPGTWLCHDICQLGATDLTKQLADLRGWLDRNPDEVVTLVVQDGISVADTERAVRASGLLRSVATPPPDPGRWPTLKTMIQSGRRLVILAENADPPDGWYRNFFRYASDTPFDNAAPDKISCQVNRGSAGAPLLLMNNWVTRAASSRRDAAVTNSRAFLFDQVARCRRTRGRGPTFLAVDFAGIGDLTAVVAELNGMPASPGD